MPTKRAMIAFEIHTYRDGQWRIDSIFDDREMALFEAQRIDAGRRYAGVLVIEESYDAAANRATNRTLYRGGRFANRVWGAMPQVRRRLRRPGPQARRRARDKLAAGGGPQIVSGGPGPIGAALLLIVILGVGLAALLALRYAAELLR